MARRRYIRRGASKADGGASWISYSDMMAALLLVFVLVLCYSVYQYFLMLETKTTELDEQSALLTQQQATLDEQREELTAQQAALTDKQNELTAALTQLDEKESLLNDQSLTLEEQEKIILAAQTALSQEEELNAANQELTNKQQELADATILLGQQQDTLNAQQQKLDDLVGVRTEIVRDLTAALSQADLKATVDGNTGDIMLESAVFFDVAKSNIKDSGRALLDEFIPVYLGVLLQPEYVDYLGEIIIEGHTDTQGTYLVNLELSQERALSVATYCLQMPTLSEEQLEKLREILTAKGRSYSDPIYNEDGTINMDASRRVEFKFRMKDSEMIDEIRNILGSGVNQ